MLMGVLPIVDLAVSGYTARGFGGVGIGFDSMWLAALASSNCQSRNHLHRQWNTSTADLTAADLVTSAQNIVALSI